MCAWEVDSTLPKLISDVFLHFKYEQPHGAPRGVNGGEIDALPKSVSVDSESAFAILKQGGGGHEVEHDRAAAQPVRKYSVARVE